MHDRVGLAKSFDVNPGDVFDLEAYAKYEAPTANPSDIDALFSQVVSAFSLGSNTTPLDGAAAYSAFENLFQGGNPWINSSMWEEEPPKAYLNYLLFDENFVLVDFGFDQISADCQQEIPDPTPVPHDHLSLHVKVKQKGYLYVYLSNEQSVAVTNVYFDDMTIVHYTSVEQVSDYYPFGLTFNSYQRENSVDQRWKFQGQEHIDDLGLNWDSFKWRNHQPDIGRFFNIDPLAEKYYHNSPYAFSENKVIAHVELEGLESVNFMVAKFTANKTEFRSPEQAIRNPSIPKNGTFGDVRPHTSNESLSFNVDLQTGANSINDGSTHDFDKNFISEAIDAFNDESGKLDFTLDVKVEDGKFQIDGTIDGSAFNISGDVNASEINMTSEMSGVSKGDGAVIKAGSGDFKSANSIINTKQAGNETSSKQESKLKYYINERGTTYIPDNDQDKNKRTTQP